MYEAIKAISVVVMLVIGQTLWKLGLKNVGEFEIREFSKMLTLAVNPFIIAGVVLYGLATILWLSVLSKNELSYIFPIMSLSYVLVLIPSYFIFREDISISRLVAIFVIMIGVALLIKS